MESFFSAGSKTNLEMISRVLEPTDNTLLSRRITPIEPSRPVTMVSLSYSLSPTFTGITTLLRSTNTDPFAFFYNAYSRFCSDRQISNTYEKKTGKRNKGFHGSSYGMYSVKLESIINWLIWLNDFIVYWSAHWQSSVSVFTRYHWQPFMIEIYLGRTI